MRRLALFVGIVTLASCAWWKSAWPILRDDLVVAVPTAIVATATAGMSVGVQFVLTLGTCVAAKGFTDVASRDSGETIGSGAQDAELKRMREWIPRLQADINSKAAAITDLSVAKDRVEGTVSWLSKLLERAKWAGLVMLAWLGIKYIHPKSRAARNFWGGLFALLRGEARAGLRKIISANGIAHTEPPGLKQV